jgi:hypothetical protein
VINKVDVKKKINGIKMERKKIAREVVLLREERKKSEGIPSSKKSKPNNH